MNYKVIGQSFRKKDYVIYPCPNCGKWSLKNDANTIVTKETARSQKSHEEYGWEPEWIEKIFSSWFVCEDTTCAEIVVCSGTVSYDSEIEENNVGEPSLVYYEYHIPKVFIPNLNYLDIPLLCPVSVKDKLNEAFQLTLLSPSSAANKVRAAVETLLTELKVKRYSVKSGKRSLINLHNRIELAARRKIITDELKDMLLAIKWLGNDGSHAVSNITKNDILDAYEIIEYILKNIYLSNRSLQDKVKKILKHKGIKKK